MKADDITSEQAWEDFKAGYSDFEEKHIGKDREGDKATLEDKLDIMNAKLEELNTDVSRLTDSVPQALGTIEEGKTIEEEAEESQELGEELGAEEGAENPEAEGGEDDFFGADDGLDEYFAEDGEEAEEGAESPEDEKADGDEDFAEDSDMETEKQGDEASENDSVVSADGDDNGDMENVEGESSEDDDFIPIDELDDSDEESEEGEEPAEDEEPDEDEKEEVLEKMVRILTKMDRRITRLERENEGLKKQLSARTVQPQTTNVAKARPRPNTNLKLVKGSYNRPPVSTQYVANQRDVGVGVRKSESQGENTSVFRQGLNEVFEQCNRIANQTN